MSALALTACGGSSASSSSATTAPASAGNPAAGFQDYQNCLKEHGVTINLPNGRGAGGNGSGPPADFTPPEGFDPNNAQGGGPPGGGGMQKPDNVDQKTWDSAQSACASKMPSLGQGGARGSTELQAYQSCLKDHGVDMTNTSVDRTSEAFKNAQEACKELLPARTPPTTGASS
jgi:hypothetical protein